VGIVDRWSLFGGGSLLKFKCTSIVTYTDLQTCIHTTNVQNKSNFKNEKKILVNIDNMTNVTPLLIRVVKEQTMISLSVNNGEGR